MATTQYIGPRLIPTGKEPYLYDPTQAYEQLQFVQDEHGGTYLSMIPVPPNAEFPEMGQSNKYWLYLSAWNAQVAEYAALVEQYRADIEAGLATIDELRADLDSLNGELQEDVELITADIEKVNAKVDAFRTFDVVDSAYIGMNMAFFGAIEFNTNPYGSVLPDNNTPVDYVNGACVMDGICYTYSDTQNFTNPGVMRKFDMSGGNFLGQTVTNGCATHPAAMSAYDHKIYVCGSAVENGPCFLYIFDSGMALTETIPLGKRMYAVAKTHNPTTEKGMFIGFEYASKDLVHFNIVNGAVQEVSRFSTGMKKVTNGMTLCKNDTLLAINTLKNTSIAVYDIESGELVGECSVGIQDSPVELEDSFEYNGYHYLVFSINEGKDYKRTSDGIGFATVRLFSDTHIDVDVESQWLPINGGNRIYCAHTDGQTQFKGDGGSASPLMSLTFATAMLSHSSSGLEIIVTRDSEFWHFPALRASNCIYIHPVDATLVIDDCINCQNGAYLRIYADEVSGWNRKSGSTGACLYGLNSLLFPNIARYALGATYGIYTSGCFVNGHRSITQCPGIYLLNSVFNYTPEAIITPMPNVVANNSTLQGFPLYNKATPSSGTTLAAFIEKARMPMQLEVRIEDNANHWANCTVSNGPNHQTFRGVGFMPYVGLFGVALYQINGAPVLECYDTSGARLQNMTLDRVFGL